jgi:cytochrome c oxidase subunit III
VSDTAAHGAHPPGFAHQFENMIQQREAGTLGMWVFLVTEILFFGGMFTSYIIYRLLHFAGFEAGSHLLKVKFGATNTVVLIVSSLTMALAIRAAQTGKRKGQIIGWLLLTMFLGALFLGLKLRYEWYADYVEGIVPGISFYFFMTGLHAIHMVIGLGILTVLVVLTARNKFSPQYYAPLEISGLYWHFVDIVWIFLFPLLYLIGGRY